jgi:hypothetical protein
LNIGDIFEALINILMKLGLNCGDINVELNEISVEFVGSVVEELMVLPLEETSMSFELLKDIFDTLKIVVLQSLELANGGEKVNQFGDSSAEEIEFTEDLVW